MQDRAALDDRTDVVTYTTAPFEAPITLAGDIRLIISAFADQPSFDVSVVLSRVTPAGQVFNLTQGFRRISGAADAPFAIGMRAVCATIEAGDALRLSLAAASFPAFAVNPGTGAALVDIKGIDARVVTVSFGSGGGQPTLVELPVIA
jgi:putative CocE/NonD family hydrolase